AHSHHGRARPGHSARSTQRAYDSGAWQRPPFSANLFFQLEHDATVVSSAGPGRTIEPALVGYDACIRPVPVGGAEGVEYRFGAVGSNLEDRATAIAVAAGAGTKKGHAIEIAAIVDGQSAKLRIASVSPSAGEGVDHGFGAVGSKLVDNSAVVNPSG